MNNTILKLYDIYRFIEDNAYIEDYDGDSDDEPIVRRIYKGLSQKEIKTVLIGINDLMEDIRNEKEL